MRTMNKKINFHNDITVVGFASYLQKIGFMCWPFASALLLKQFDRAAVEIECSVGWEQHPHWHLLKSRVGLLQYVPFPLGSWRCYFPKQKEKENAYFRDVFVPADMILWGVCMRLPGWTWWRRLPVSSRETMCTASMTRLLHISTTAATKPGQRCNSSCWICSRAASWLTLVGVISSRDVFLSNPTILDQ